MNESKICLDRVSFEYGQNRKRVWHFLEGMKKRRNGGDKKVLDNIDLEIKNGEFVSILGHSGCGKSTLLKVVAGFVKPTGGTVWIDGQPVEGPRGDHVFVFQEGALFPWLTILKNVSLSLRSIKEPSEKLKKAKEYLELVSLEEFENYYPHMLSGGMRQRAEIARAIAAQPDVLLVDEPFSGLDYLTRLQMREELLYLHMMLGKTTILFVTHDIDEALQLSDRIVVLTESPGRVKSCCSINVPHPRLLSSPELSGLRTDIYHQLGVHAAL